MLQCSALAENIKRSSTLAGPASSSATTDTNEQGSKAVVEECENEWKANQEAMIKHDMDEASYVAQCSVKDDVPSIPSGPMRNVAPSPAPK
jgi:hypothetical protein